MKKSTKITIIIVSVASAVFLAALALLAVRKTWKVLETGLDNVELSEEEIENPLGMLFDDTGDDSSESSGEKEWAVYLYLCGSDLETKSSMATANIGALLSAGLPDNVTFVIETGGAKEWHNEVVDASKLQRYIVAEDDIYLADEQPLKSMGDAQTLADFLQYCTQNYPAKKEAVVLWDHGGATEGVCYDEIFDMDCLTPDEIESAFDSAFSADIDNPPLEMLGFDACLMATIDIAAKYSAYAKYMVASEEISYGWDYNAIGQAFKENPGMDGKQLGTVVCDSYYESLSELPNVNVATYSVLDLGKFGELFDAYEAFGQEALEMASENPEFLSFLSDYARRTENYGNNTDSAGYHNQLDLADFARHLSPYMDCADEVINAVNDCVVHNISGKYRSRAAGISAYFPYSGQLDDLETYKKVSRSLAFNTLYGYDLTGELSDDEVAYLAELGISEMPERQYLTDVKWEDSPRFVDGDGDFNLQLGKEATNILTEVRTQIFYYDVANDRINVVANDYTQNDWENGIFSAYLSDMCCAIDSTPLYIEPCAITDDYFLYTSPILLNGEEHHLEIACDAKTGEYSIIGALEGIQEDNCPDKEIKELQPGDVVTVLQLSASMSERGDEDSNDFSYVAVAEITITNESALDYISLPDGNYSLFYVLQDARHNQMYTAGKSFNIEDGEVDIAF